MKPSDSSSSRARRNRRLKKLALGLLAMIALYALLGFFVVPPVVRAVASSQVEKNLHARLDMESVAFNPFTLRMRLTGISLQDLQGQDVFRLGEGQFAVSPATLTHFAPIVKEVLLDEPAIFLSRNSDGEINVLRLLKETETEKPPPAELPKFAIQRFSITGGLIEVDDAGLEQPVALVFAPIAFDLEDFSTFRSEGNQLRFSAKDASGGTVEGSGSFAVAPVAASVELMLNQFDLSVLAAYVREFVDVDLRQGRLDLQLGVQFQADSEEDPISGNLLSLVLSDLQLFAAEAEAPFFALEELAIANAKFAAWDPRLDVESIQISGGNVRVRRLENGAIDLLQLLPDTETPADDSNTSDAPPAFAFSVSTVGIRDFAFFAEDLATGESAQMEGRLHTAEIREITDNLSNPIAFNLDGDLLAEGSFAIAGNLVPNPLSGEIELAVDAIPLSRFNPWASQFMDLSLQSGAAGLNGKISLAPGTGAVPTVAFAGTAAVKNFEAREGEARVLAFTQFELSGLDLQSDPLAFHSDRIRLVAPQATLALEEGGQLNLLRLLRVSEAAEAAPEDAAPAENASPETLATASAEGFPLEFDVDAIEIESGDISVSDQTIAPAYSTRLQQLRVEIADLASDPASRATIRVSGELPGASQFTVSGTTNAFPADLFADMTVELARFGLVPVSPYTGHFIGRAVSDGHLSFTVKAKVEGEDLSAQNAILLKDFRLGERVESENALNLPLDLALGLLRDRNGEIAIDIPVSGRLNDPQFSVANVVTNALLSMIRNVAGSPFAALGRLVGAKSDTLSEVAFDPGQFELSDEGLATLRELAAALHQRPALKIEIAATADPAADRPVLLENRLREELLAHQAAAGTEWTTIADDPLTDEALIRALYESRFGPLEIPPAPEEEIEIAEAPETADEPNLAEEMAPEEELDEVAESKPWIVVHVPQWMKRLFSRSAAEPESEIAEALEIPEEQETTAPEIAEEAKETVVAEEVVIPTPEEMKAELLGQIEIAESALYELAEKRAETVRQLLLETGQVESARISTGAIAVDSGTKAKFKLH